MRHRRLHPLFPRAGPPQAQDNAREDLIAAVRAKDLQELGLCIGVADEVRLEKEAPRRLDATAQSASRSMAALVPSRV